MSARNEAEREAERLDSVPTDEVGRVLAHGLQGAVYALLDVADAIREQTIALTTPIETEFER